MTLPDDVRRLVDGPNFAHLATLMADGAPQVVPVWVGREGDRILIGTSSTSLKARNAKRDPRVALSILDFANPYEEAQLRGRVVEQRPDPALTTKDATSRKYTGAPFPWRDPATSVTLVVEVDRVKYAKLPFRHTPGGALTPGGAR
jgi:PPOX class probable F420-dependent enzyme